MFRAGLHRAKKNNSRQLQLNKVTDPELICEEVTIKEVRASELRSYLRKIRGNRRRLWSGLCSHICSASWRHTTNKQAVTDRMI